MTEFLKYTNSNDSADVSIETNSEYKLTRERVYKGLRRLASQRGVAVLVKCSRIGLLSVYVSPRVATSDAELSVRVPGCHKLQMTA